MHATLKVAIGNNLKTAPATIILRTVLASPVMRARPRRRASFIQTGHHRLVPVALRDDSCVLHNAIHQVPRKIVMPHPTSPPKADILTFRIDPALKAAFAEIAGREAKPVGELLRELVLEHVEREQRRKFAAEARRQSREAAAAALNPTSDEAAVQRELEADLEEYAGEWK